MISLGKEYSDSFGDWAEKRIGINPVKVIKDIGTVVSATTQSLEVVPKGIIDEYYTQIDRAQDLLAKTFSDRTKITIVLVDELDRCDPDEAFSVIKQLRVFFAMRDLPIAFVICANPEPIGLAIRHKYGLDTDSGDYESRRILEKFVDVYIDMSEKYTLERFVHWLWTDVNKDIGEYAFITLLDAAYIVSEADENMILNVTALEAMQSDNRLYGNLRLLRKTLDRVCTRSFPNSHMLWTAWHLELAGQMDPTFRREIATTSIDMSFISIEANKRVLTAPLEWRNGKMVCLANPRGTLFGLYRSAFWDASRARLAELERQQEPESRERARILDRWIGDFRRMDFLAPRRSKWNRLTVERGRGALHAGAIAAWGAVGDGPEGRVLAGAWLERAVEACRASLGCREAAA